MHKMHQYAIVIPSLLLAASSVGRAQNVVITPSAPTMALGKTLQFSGQLTDSSHGDVIWSAGGVVGGSTTAGSISPTGLYQAPAALPAQNPVQITATSKANPAKTSSIYVYLITAGPAITAVTPNPIAVGNLTVKIQGTGFKVGAAVYQSYGSNSLIQLSTTAVTATSIIATGYQGSAASATFCVRNPGTDYSNSIAVPVGGATAATHTLTVVQGSGGGAYVPGKVVTIVANTPPAGQSFLSWTGAAVANAASATTTLTMPNANTTVTANYGAPVTKYVLTVANGSAGGSYAAGATVAIAANTPPSGQTFQNWTGATVANPNSAATTLTMPAANTSVMANYTSQAVTIPYPVTSHPRLWVTTNALPRLRSWATASNPIYAQGMAPLLTQAVDLYNTQFFPGGVPNPNYPDPGDTQGYSGHLTEQVGAVLAFNSLIDPDASNRIKYAQYSRNILMYAMNQAALGHLTGAPFRDPLFATYNRANGSGEQWPLMVDWIYNAQDAQGNAILTAADKATIRKVFLMWANDCLNASTTGGDHPVPIGVTNSTQLLPGDQPYRMASNNYYLGHARILTMMSLCIDPADDPTINTSAPASQLGNTLRSYLLNANGAWLYQEFAMMGDPATVASAYGIPGNGAGFGLASGGLPPEGMLYGHSFGFILGQLLALQTAGFNNPAYGGPQTQLIGAPVWDRYVTGYLSSLTPTAKTDPTQPWMGPVYGFASYGDLLRLWVTPDVMQSFSLLALLDQQNGKTSNLNAARWMSVNASEGGAGALLSRVTNPWSYSSSDAILYYMLLDPAAPTPTDPRPSFATTFVDPGAGRVVAHSDWSASGSMFDYRASWESINHQDGDGGQFEFFRKGEWLTKEMSNYDNNGVGLTTTYHNTMALQNWSAAGTPSMSWFEGGEWTYGSQWMLGSNAGDPATVTSSGPGYVYAASDLTKLYNHPNIWTPSSGATDITQATRSIVWLGDYTVVYDRAASLHSGLFKRFNLSLTTAPAISGNTATETLASGQQLFVQTLLPAAPAFSVMNGAANLNPIAQLEPTRYVYSVQDPTLPADTRFLHVLQGADPGAPIAPATHTQSTGGTTFDGAEFGAQAVYFPVSATAPIVTTTFSAGAGVHTLLITGLTPGAFYGASVTAGGSAAITVIPGGTGYKADPAGVLKITF